MLWNLAMFFLAADGECLAANVSAAQRHCPASCSPTYAHREANFWSVAAELLRSYSAQNLQTSGPYPFEGSGLLEGTSLLRHLRNAFLVTSATSRSWTRAFGLCKAGHTSRLRSAIAPFCGSFAKAYRHSSVTNSALGALARRC